MILCACGQRPVDNGKAPVENPATKILRTMSLNLKTPNYKSVQRLDPTGVREAVDNLNALVGAIFNALDFVNARIDAIEAQINTPTSDATGARGGSTT